MAKLCPRTFWDCEHTKDRKVRAYLVTSCLSVLYAYMTKDSTASQKVLLAVSARLGSLLSVFFGAILNMTDPYQLSRTQTLLNPNSCDQLRRAAVAVRFVRSVRPFVCEWYAVEWR